MRRICLPTKASASRVRTVSSSTIQCRSASSKAGTYRTVRVLSEPRVPSLNPSKHICPRRSKAPSSKLSRPISSGAISAFGKITKFMDAPNVRSARSITLSRRSYSTPAIWLTNGRKLSAEKFKQQFDAISAAHAAGQLAVPDILALLSDIEGTLCGIEEPASAQNSPIRNLLQELRKSLDQIIVPETKLAHIHHLLQQLHHEVDLLLNRLSAQHATIGSQRENIASLNKNVASLNKEVASLKARMDEVQIERFLNLISEALSIFANNSQLPALPARFHLLRQIRNSIQHPHSFATPEDQKKFMVEFRTRIEKEADIAVVPQQYLAHARELLAILEQHQSVLKHWDYGARRQNTGRHNSAEERQAALLAVEREVVGATALGLAASSQRHKIAQENMQLFYPDCARLEDIRLYLFNDMALVAHGVAPNLMTTPNARIMFHSEVRVRCPNISSPQFHQLHMAASKQKTDQPMTRSHGRVFVVECSNSELWLLCTHHKSRNKWLHHFESVLPRYMLPPRPAE